MPKPKSGARGTRKLTGELANPIARDVPQPPSGTATDILWHELTPQHKAARKAADAKTYVEMMRKLPLLAQHYGIEGSPLADHGAALHLLLVVCREHITGFQVAEKKGRPKGTATKWNIEERLRFIRDVEEIQKKYSCTDRDAIWRLMERSPYAPVGGRPTTKNGRNAQRAIDILQTRLGEARSFWGDLCAMSPEVKKVVFDIFLPPE